MKEIIELHKDQRTLEVSEGYKTGINIMVSEDEEYGDMAIMGLSLKQAERLAKAIMAHVERVRKGTWDEVK